MTFSELAAVMPRLSLESDAWRDFAVDFRQRLSVASLTAVAGFTPPDDFAHDWRAVAEGDRGD